MKPEDLTITEEHLKNGHYRITVNYADIEHSSIINQYNEGHALYIISQLSIKVLESYINERYRKSSGRIPKKYKTTVHNLRKTFFKSKLWEERER